MTAVHPVNGYYSSMGNSSRRVHRKRHQQPPMQPQDRPTQSQDQHRERLLYLVFTLSGLVGLVYEATWTRYLQLFLGHAAYAQVLVLALFMGGMGAGALLAGRLSHNTRINALPAYATIEAALGFCALVFHPLFVAVTAYAYDVVHPAMQGSPTGVIVQWLLASAMILP